jgi:CRISPR-associated protein (TIGR03986 family)
MSNVKSPYNFVPAPTEKDVFTPDWADQVSHDIPFSDGESGEIEIEITAETPIFIRDGKKKDEKTEEFSHFKVNGEKQYFIPATSLKGMVRNVLEIMSFSKLNKDFVYNSRFSQRDISSHDSKYMKKYDKDNIQAGWLFIDGNRNWKIEKCESFAFIHHKELKDSFSIDFRSKFLINQKRNHGKSLPEKFKNAVGKYKDQIVSEIGLVFKFTTTLQDIKNRKGVIIGKRTIAKNDELGKSGTLVFTGQPSLRYEPIGESKDFPFGKTREFVFFDSNEKSIYPIPKELVDDIKFIYNDHDNYAVSEDWEYFREDFLKVGKKVPVFFSSNSDGEVLHFGLAYMYKLPYDYKTHELYPIKDQKEGSDLAQIIFGYTSKKEQNLKGRVFFGHALADLSTVKFKDKAEEEILSSPKASYFPFYLNQFKKDDEEYYTYDDENATLRGFKRYPVRKNAVRGNYDEKQKQNKNTWAKFKPIQKDAKFSSKIRFHNLKKEELGALLSSLTFHANNEICFHSLGGAKPLGYGRIKINIKNLYCDRFKWNFEECIISYEELMKTKIPNWINSPALTELFSMTILGSIEDSLTYSTTNEYQSYKNKKENNFGKPLDKLDDYSTISKNISEVRKIKSASVKFQPQERIDLNFESYLDLQKTLNEKYEIFKEFTEENKAIIYQGLIKIILIDKHKDSIKKLKKPSHWDGNILNWLGEDLMEKLLKETGIEVRE